MYTYIIMIRPRRNRNRFTKKTKIGRRSRRKTVRRGRNKKGGDDYNNGNMDIKPWMDPTVPITIYAPYTG